jgi:hypothetical protein
LPGNGECGYNPEISSTGGLVGVRGFTRPGMFPFNALVGILNSEIWSEVLNKTVTSNKTRYACGGTLINHWYVVTAAQCHVEGKQISTVRLGEWEIGRDLDCRSDLCLFPVQDFEITNDQVKVHKNYGRTSSNVSQICAVGEIGENTTYCKVLLVI